MKIATEVRAVTIMACLAGIPAVAKVALVDQAAVLSQVVAPRMTVAQ